MASRPPSSSDNQPSPNGSGRDVPFDSSMDAPTLPPESNGLDENSATIAPQNSTPSAGQIGEGPSVGKTFGDYELLGEIARGGMGVVFRARQKSLDRVVALKMILSGQLASDEEVQRFISEANAAAKLDHSNIVPIYEIGEEDDKHFFAMKLIEGSHLGAELGRMRNDLPTGIALLEKVCRAVHHAHQRAILHRDLKPGNILIDESGEPFVTDLGLARKMDSQSDLTRTGAIVGTPSYMPPEQAAGSSDITTSADVYSLGAILYELLTGRPPFRGATPMDTLMQVINDAPEKPSASAVVDRGLEMVALKCLSKDPAQRYTSADELANELQRWIVGEPLTVRAPTFGAIFKNWMRQNFGRAGYILVVGGLGGVLAGMAFWGATYQTSIESKFAVFNELTSVDAPFSLQSWDMPFLLGAVCLLVFAGIMALLGYLTALLVRTKNRSADIAAGVVVGVVAAAGLFFTCFGSMSTMLVEDNADVLRLSKIAVAVDGNDAEVLDVYPEFENWDRAKRVDVLVRKIGVERAFKIHHGILVGTLCCLLFFLSAGVIETMIAGPIVRAYPQWWKSIAIYGFSAFPFVFAIVVFGFQIAIWLLSGVSAVIWSWLIMCIFSWIVLAILAESRKWHLTIRGTINIIALPLFVIYCVIYFPLIPGVAETRLAIRNSLRLVEKFPENDRLKIKASGALMESGDFMLGTFHYPQARSDYENAIQVLSDVADDKLSSQRDYRLAKSWTEIARCISRKESTEYLCDKIEKHPENKALLRESMKHFGRSADFESAKLALEGQRVDNANQWRNVRRSIGMFAEAAKRNRRISKDVAERAKYESQVFELSRIATESFGFPVHQSSAMLSLVEQPQKWALTGPLNKEDEQKAIAKLTKLRSSDSFNDLATIDADRSVELADWRTVESLDLRSINLLSVFPEAGDNIAAIAVGVITSDKVQSVKFFLGSDDGATVWVNGEQVFSKAIERQLRARQDRFKVELNQGENIILIKVDQAAGDWGFAIEIEDLKGWPAIISWAELGLPLQ